jgi:hypothetical protein
MTDKNDQSRNKQPKVRSQQNPQSFFNQQNQDKPNNNTGNVKLGHIPRFRHKEITQIYGWFLLSFISL